MAETIFADRITNLKIHGGLVRFDLAVVDQFPREKNPGKVSVTHRLVMPIEGFVAAFGMQENVINKLKADGVLKEREASAKSAE